MSENSVLFTNWLDTDRPLPSLVKRVSVKVSNFKVSIRRKKVLSLLYKTDIRFRHIQFNIIIMFIYILGKLTTAWGQWFQIVHFMENWRFLGSAMNVSSSLHSNCTIKVICVLWN